MIQKRYEDSTKLIVDANELELTGTAQVLVYREDKWYDEITVDLQGQEEKFEELKPLIVYAAQNLCKMDVIAQRYSALHGDSKFVEGYKVAYICLGALEEISVYYYGMRENTEFEVIFQRVGDELLLKSFGMTKNIPPDWDKAFEL